MTVVLNEIYVDKNVELADEVEVVYISKIGEIVFEYENGVVDVMDEKTFLNWFRLKPETVSGWVRVVYDEDFGGTYFTDTIHVTKENARREFEANEEGLFNGLKLLDIIEITWNGVTSKS